MEGAPSCLTVAAALATVLQAFPFASGIEMWVRYHLGRGEPHLADAKLWEVPSWLYKEPGLNGWLWPADPLLGDVQPSAVLTPRACLAADQLQASGTSDDDDGGGKWWGRRRRMCMAATWTWFWRPQGCAVAEFLYASNMAERKGK